LSHINLLTRVLNKDVVAARHRFSVEALSGRREWGDLSSIIAAITSQEEQYKKIIAKAVAGVPLTLAERGHCLQLVLVCWFKYCTPARWVALVLLFCYPSSL
jgi:hypothetical protein